MNEYLSIDEIKNLLIEEIAIPNLEFQNNIEIKLIKILKQSLLRLQVWTIEHFLALVSGFLYTKMLQNLQKIQIGKQEDLENLMCGERQGFDLRHQALQHIMNYYYAELNKLKSKLFPENRLLPPAEWLKFVRKNPGRHAVNYYYEVDVNNPEKVVFWRFICGIELAPVMEKLIKYHHFNLEEKFSDEGIESGLSMNIGQAAKYLSQELRKDIRERNVLELCYKYNFNCYIERDTFFEKKLRSSTLENIEDVEEAIKNKILDCDYKYSIAGLIRLAKNYDNKLKYCEDFNGQTVKHLTKSSSITLKTRLNNNWFYRAISISEYLNGEIPIIHSNGNNKKITWNELIFLEEELIDFIDIQNTQGKKKSQKERREAFKESIEKVKQIAWKEGISIVDTSLPGTKDEFIDLIKAVDTKWKAYSNFTLADYLKALGYKFKPGVKKKSKEIQGFQKLINSTN